MLAISVFGGSLFVSYYSGECLATQNNQSYSSLPIYNLISIFHLKIVKSPGQCGSAVASSTLRDGYSVPCRGSYLGCKLDPWVKHVWEATNPHFPLTSISLSLSLSFTHFFSLQKIYACYLNCFPAYEFFSSYSSIAAITSYCFIPTSIILNWFISTNIFNLHGITLIWVSLSV